MDANIIPSSLKEGYLKIHGGNQKNLCGRTKSLENSKSKPQRLDLTFTKGDISAVNGKKMTFECASSFKYHAGNHGIGRDDIEK